MLPAVTFSTHRLKGTQELSELGLMLITFLGIAYTALEKEHVRVELLLMYLPENIRLLFEAVSGGLCLMVSGIITWKAFNHTATVYGRGLTTSLLELPLWPFILILAPGCGVLSITFLRDTLKSAHRCVTASWESRHILISCGVFLSVVIALLAFHLAGGGSSSPVISGIVGMLIMVCFLFMGVPIGFCMILVGAAGMMYLAGSAAGFSLLQPVPFNSTTNYSMTVVPLFILMGAFAFKAGLSKDLYVLVYRFLGHLPGGLAIATVGACGCFAAISGSSLATAATMGMVALPEMKRYKYDPALSTGCIAAGGSLGILIPPSVVLILYGVLTNQPITELFIAGFIPGVMEALFYIITILIMCKMRPELGPPGKRSNFKDRMVSVKETWGVLVLFFLVIGGLYAGAFTPTEAGGIGAFGVLVFIAIRGKLSIRKFYDSLFDSVKTASMCLTVFLGAMFLGYFLTISQIPYELSEFVAALPLNRYVILILILVAYMILGCVMDSLSIVLLTVPIFFPLVQALGFNPIWFGIIMVRIVEIGMITPPIGINVFIIKGVVKNDVPMHTIFKGILPFLIADIIQVILLILIPEITLFLPQLLGAS